MTKNLSKLQDELRDFKCIRSFFRESKTKLSRFNESHGKNKHEYLIHTKDMETSIEFALADIEKLIEKNTKAIQSLTNKITK